MAKIEYSGIGDYSAKLAKLGRTGIGICKAAVYEGADEVANAIRAATEALPTVSAGSAIRAWRAGEKSDGITKEQKQGLLDGLDISTIRDDDGYINTRIDFVGYNTVQTKAFPKGQPNAVIARSIESGSSARTKNPFVRRAVNAVRAKAAARMGDKITEMINKTMEG